MHLLFCVYYYLLLLFALLSITVLIYSAVRLVKSNLLTIASKWTFHFKPCLLTGSCQEMKKFASVNMRWKKKESYWLTQPIIAHGSGSAGCWKTRAREKNSRARSRTAVFTLTDYRTIQQTRPRIAQCKPSLRLN